MPPTVLNEKESEPETAAAFLGNHRHAEWHTYTPRPPLCDFVHLFWLFKGRLPRARMERIMPDGSMQLIINLAEDRLRIYGDRPDQFETIPGSLVSGMRSRHFLIDTASQEWMLGIHFKPGGARPFLGLPTHALTDLAVPLEDFWRSEADNLRERLLHAPDGGAMFQILERHLLALARVALERHPAVAFALRQMHSVPALTMADLTAKVGYSQRRFIQLFRQEVGLTPKLYSRICRFQRALHLIGPGTEADWPEIALSCGYFDQAHFINDFRAFAGMSPTRYLALRGHHPNHVIVPEPIVVGATGNLFL